MQQIYWGITNEEKLKNHACELGWSGANGAAAAAGPANSLCWQLCKARQLLDKAAQNTAETCLLC